MILKRQDAKSAKTCRETFQYQGDIKRSHGVIRVQRQTFRWNSNVEMFVTPLGVLGGLAVR
jgi:hypothetical protein